MAKIPELRADQLLHNYKEAFNLDEAAILDQIKLQRASQTVYVTIENFEGFLKKLTLHYKNLRAHLKGLIEVKQHQVDF